MIAAIRQIDRLDWFNRASVVYLLLVVPLYWNYGAYDTRFLTADEGMITLGNIETDYLWERHVACVEAGSWKGRFVDDEGIATVTDRAYNDVMDRTGGLE